MADDDRNRGGSSGVSCGISMGTALAICISWSANHSLPWAIAHGIAGWFYVLWWCLYGATPT